MFHFYKSTNDDKSQIISSTLPTMSRYWEQLQISIIFFGNKFSSFHDAKVANQLCLDDFKNAKRVLVMYNFFDILPTIKLILYQDVLFWSISLELK